MRLGLLIEGLKKHPRDQRVTIGFGRPHSYRGYYEDLAFEPVHDTTVGEMIDAAESALGAVYQGWKGGDYKMGEFTECWIATRGTCGEGIGTVLLSYMLAGG